MIRGREHAASELHTHTLNNTLLNSTLNCHKTPLDTSLSQSVQYPVPFPYPARHDDDFFPSLIFARLVCPILRVCVKFPL